LPSLAEAKTVFWSLGSGYVSIRLKLARLFNGPDALDQVCPASFE